jgi:hypothetical protein
MADQASVAAAREGAESVRLRAEVLAVFACNQLGRGAGAGGRALRALRAAQRTGEETTERLVRIELAACAADASAPSTGLAVLQPVFDRVSAGAASGAPAGAPTTRAAAMVTAADCLARLGGGPDVAALLTCADQLYDRSRSVEPDAVLLRRGVVHARMAAYHRRCGDHRTAESTARAGMALIEELSDGDLDTGQVSGSLTVELVLALLDGGQVAEAVVAAQPMLRSPARPAGASAACWLRLALVSRVHLPTGRHALARRLLDEAAADAERNHLDAAIAECRQLQAQLHQACAELSEALQSIRAAHVADRRWRDIAAELRTLLAAEFGHPSTAAELRSELAAVLASQRASETSAQSGRDADARMARPRPIRARHAAPTPLPVARTVEPAVIPLPWSPPPSQESTTPAVLASSSQTMPAPQSGSMPETEPSLTAPMLDSTASTTAAVEPAVTWATTGAGEPPVDGGPAEHGEPSEPPRLLGANGFDRGSGRHRSDVAMADLLAEALLAYQNGRRSRLAAAAGGASLGSAALPEASPPEAPVPAEASPPEPPGDRTAGRLRSLNEGTEPSARPRIRWLDLPGEIVWREPRPDRRA